MYFPPLPYSGVLAAVCDEGDGLVRLHDDVGHGPERVAAQERVGVVRPGVVNQRNLRQGRVR